MVEVSRSPEDRDQEVRAVAANALSGFAQVLRSVFRDPSMFQGEPTKERFLEEKCLYEDYSFRLEYDVLSEGPSPGYLCNIHIKKKGESKELEIAIKIAPEGASNELGFWSFSVFSKERDSYGLKTKAKISWWKTKDLSRTPQYEIEGVKSIADKFQGLLERWAAEHGEVSVNRDATRREVEELMTF